MAAPLALGIITGLHDGIRSSLETVRDMGFGTIQLQFGSRFEDEFETLHQALNDTRIEVTTVFCGFPGESYRDIPTVRETVGLVPRETRAQRVQNVDTISRFAQRLGVPLVALHLGFIPEDAADPLHAEVVEVTRQLCDSLAQRGQTLTLETGQETAAGLDQFIRTVDRDNLRVNFDPANMILYGKDKPLPALDILMPYIVSVHCKDGRWPTEPEQLGEETPLGEGDVDLPAFIEKILRLGYRGPLTIEREISGEEQRRDILRGKALLEDLLARAQ